MSISRLIISLVWLAIGGVIGAVLLWLPGLQLSSWWWLLILLVIAIAFRAVPNWWQPVSGFCFFMLAWAVGGLITWIWAIAEVPVGRWWCNQWDWIWFWPVAGIGLALIGWLIARCYLPIEFRFHRDEFAEWTTTRDVWRSGLSENVAVLATGFLAFGGWFLLLMPLNYFDTTVIDRVVYALLFAWIAVWLGKLSSTLKAKADHSLLNPRYERALIKGVSWDSIRDDNKSWVAGGKARGH